jgi:hypothetical protein
MPIRRRSLHDQREAAPGAALAARD